MADLPENPNNREEEYLADMAGEDGTKPNKPWSRKEAYLDAIDGRMDGIDAKIAALATDISLKGSVADYAHLPDDAAIGDAYITEDTGTMYVWVGDQWTALNEGGGAEILYCGKQIADSETGIKFYKDADLTEEVLREEIDQIADTGGAGVAFLIVYPEEEFSQSYRVAGGQRDYGMTYLVVTTTGSCYRLDFPDDQNYCNAHYQIFNGTYGEGNSQQQVLSQRGTTELVNSRVKKNEGTPTVSTVGNKGQLLEDTTNGKLYISGGRVNGNYVWTEIVAGRNATVLYADKTKLVNEAIDVLLYKDAALTTAYNYGEICQALIDGADMTLVVKDANETADWNTRWSFQLIKASYPRVASYDGISDVGVDMVFLNGMVHSFSLTSYAASPTDTAWVFYGSLTN